MQGLRTHHVLTHCHPLSSFLSTSATGAAPLVSVASVHRLGAENGGDKEAHQAQGRQERIQIPQLSQPLHTEAQRRQVIILLHC